MYLEYVEMRSRIWNNLVAIARATRRNGGKLRLLMDARSQMWNTAPMERLSVDMGMFSKRVDLYALGVKDKDQHTGARLACLTDEPCLDGRLSSLECDEGHAHLHADSANA